MTQKEGYIHVGRIFPADHALVGLHTNCNFFLAQMCGVPLLGKFLNCNFGSVNFKRASFYDGMFYDCSFVGAWMTRAYFHKAFFSKCDFAGVDFSQATGLTTCTFENTCEGLGKNKGVRTMLDPKRGVYNVLPTYTTKSAEKKLVVSSSSNAEKLVDPEPIIPVDHYRSPAEQIPESYANSDDDHCEGYEGFACYMGGDWNSYNPIESKYKYGYKENAVLECPDIQEFSNCVRGN